MSRRSDAYLAEVPQRPYDLLREGALVFAAIAVVIILLAAVFSSPDYPAVRGEDVATRQPIEYLQTCTQLLAGKSDLQDYGPPYTADRDNAQRILGRAPANWLGATRPLDAQQDLVIRPLERLAVVRPEVAAALTQYQEASPKQQQAWTSAYRGALNQARVDQGRVVLPAGKYGPVATLLDGMLALGRAGLLEGALESGARLPFTLDPTRSLLFFAGDVDSSVAEKLDMTGAQWGLVHETGPYPGAWWLWVYSLWYEIPRLAASPNIDLIAGTLSSALFLVLLFLPFLPVLNRVPRWIPVYRLIWRDWYRRRP